MWRFALTLLAAMLCLVAPAQAHRLNLGTVQAIAQEHVWADVQTTQTAYPGTSVSGGLDGSCQRQGDHYIACPLYLEAQHSEDIPADVAAQFGITLTPITTRFTATLVAVADPRERRVTFTHTPWQQEWVHGVAGSY